MDKTKIKNFAVWAREKLIDDITYKAGMLGISENGIAEKLPHSTADLHFFDIGTKNYTEISGKEIIQRSALVSAIKRKERDLQDYKEAFKYVVEEVAYTWFNRLIAIRFMEVNDYLPSGVRVLSSENKDKNEPDFVTRPFETDLEFTADEQDKIIQLKDTNKLDELFRMLFIKQCNKLHDILPELFEKTDDYSELLLTISFTDKDGIVYRLVHDILEEDFNVGEDGQIEIIGWMYQYYNIEAKAKVFSRPKGTKISKEDIPAATQLFTPDWIVRYMVENSLGRMWVEGHPNNSLKKSWNYYIEEAEQEQQVIEKLEEIKATYKNLTPDKIKVIDPCMGSGHILVYAFDILMQIYESNGYTQREAARSILVNNIYGLDIDERAYQLAYFAIMMKARQYNRRILNEKIEPNLSVVRCSEKISQNELDKMGEYKDIAQQLINDFELADEYGSLTSVSLSEIDLQNIDNQLKTISNNIDNYDLIDKAYCKELVEKLTPLIKQAKILKQKYEVVVTNPPYLPVSNCENILNDFVKSNYPDSKTDLFAAFIERCKEMLKVNCYQAMITMHSWMFLSSYEKLRGKILLTDIINMAHLGARAFEEIGGEVVQTTAFVMRKSHIIDCKGVYCRLIEPNTQKGKEEMFLSRENRYTTDQSNFSKIPSSPIAYWVSENLLIAFNNITIEKIANCCTGMQTGNNNKYVRDWYEVDYTKTAMFCENEIYKRYNCGGEFKKWYGNHRNVVMWKDNGKSIRNEKSSVIRNEKFFFKKGLSWKRIGSSGIGLRFMPEHFIFDQAGDSMFVKEIEKMYYTLAFLNSKPAELCFTFIAPTMNLTSGNMNKLPFIYYEHKKELIDDMVQENINISKIDWDSFETSWDFEKHPLIKNVSTINGAYSLWEKECEERFNKLKANEEELNRIFIDIYGLQDELTPEVEDKDVTVRKADLQRDIKSLISYAVGCMFGRYSLDVEGLAYAGGEWDSSKYKAFIPDVDNCILITDEEYFENDIVGMFCDWLKKVYGEDTLEENLDFIAKALGNKGNTSRQIIRNYFLTDFIKDHIKIYQKRPIYWLFDSGKQNGFKALCYMHRWNADTIGNMRVEYLHRMQRVYEKEIERMQEIIENSRDNKEISNATKRKEKLQKQLKESKEYDTLVAHLALSRIDIDLDDGVKVNYEKVQTANGKKMNILFKI